jgi:hypothetical protein
VVSSRSGVRSVARAWQHRLTSHQQRITGVDGAALRGQRFLEIVDGDRVARIQAGDPPVPGQVDQHRAQHQAITPLLNAIAGSAD